MDDVKSRKDIFLEAWARSCVNAAHLGHLDSRKEPIRIERIETVSGPRVGALLFRTSTLPNHLQDAGRLYTAMNANKGSIMRSLCPWEFIGEPQCYHQARSIRIEAGWPKVLAETEILLRDLPRGGKGKGRWIAGSNEFGQTICLSLNDNTAHWLVAGQTGGGKSIALLAAIVQLAQDPNNRLILIDGKYGHDMTPIKHIRTVGPLVIDHEGTREAIGWAYQDMLRRYRLKVEGRPDNTRLVIVWDEPGESLQDDHLAVLLSKLLAQGRAVNVHVIICTHNPLVESFNHRDTKRNFTGRIALKVDSADASRVVTGTSEINAQFLHGKGDAWLIVPGAYHRVQMALVDQRDFQALPAAPPLLQEWPEFNAEDNDPDPPGFFSPEEIGIALLAAQVGLGRPKLIDAVEQLTGHRPGGSRSQRLLKYGRELRAWYSERDLRLVKIKSETPRPSTA